MPAAGFLHLSTNGCKNELKSFGAFGPDMMLKGDMCELHADFRREVEVDVGISPCS